MDLSKTDSQLSDIVEQDSPQKKGSAAGAAESGGRPALVKQNLRVTTAPRIDISRASSSSQHEDSRDSSPENVFEQVGTGTLQESADDAGFTEDGASELRSSTEELFFADGEPAKPKPEEAQQVS